MPNLETHCKHCRELYGIEGREIHNWIDQPSRYYGGAHRKIRHDLETADYVSEKFGNCCGEGAKGQYLAKLCYFDHIFLDIEASKKKTLDAPNFTDEEIKELEQQKPIFEQESGRIKKQIKQLDELPPLTIREMVEYIGVKLRNKSPELKFLAEVSLRHWQKFLSSRDIPHREISEVDVTSFIAQLGRTVKSPYSRANYLGQLIAYFNYAYTHNKNLGMKLKEAKRDADREVQETKKKALPLRIDIVKRFYQEAKIPLKVAIRLLMLKQDIKIDDFDKITWIHEENGKYHFFIKTDNEEKRIAIDNDTINMAIPLLKKGKLASGSRSLQDACEKLSTKLHIEPNITPFDLREFSRGLHPDDIKQFILIARVPQSWQM